MGIFGASLSGPCSLGGTVPLVAIFPVACSMTLPCIGCILT